MAASDIASGRLRDGSAASAIGGNLRDTRNAMISVRPTGSATISTPTGHDDQSYSASFSRCHSFTRDLSSDLQAIMDCAGGDRGGVDRRSTQFIQKFQWIIGFTGGRGGIRTHGTVARTAVFKTAAFNHSATLPDARVLATESASDQPASTVNSTRQANYFALPSQRRFITLQKSRRAAPAVFRQPARAASSAAACVSATAHPAPGVPSFGSSADATH